MSETLEKKKKSQTVGGACILLSAALWGVMGLWNRYLMGVGMSPTNIVAVRNLAA